MIYGAGWEAHRCRTSGPIEIEVTLMSTLASTWAANENVATNMTFLRVIDGVPQPTTRPDPRMARIVVAMTNEIGSLGSEVAAGVAAKLGLDIVQSETVAEKVARRMGIATDAILRCLKGSPSLLDRFRIDRRKLCDVASEEILALAQQGGILIQGWSAATLLREMPQLIGVRICASVDFRVNVMMKRLGSANAVAVREEIERSDAVAGRAMHALFGIEQDDARLYHLVLNTERMSIRDCVNAVCELAENPSRRARTPLPAALNDKLLEVKLRSALAENISLSMTPLGVSVSVVDGKVRLGGTTTSGSLRAKAESIVHSIATASMIDNRILCVPSRGRLQ
jgi:cytidylate kinase